MSSSVHELRERYIKRKLGIPESEPSHIETPALNNIKSEEEIPPENEKPVPWSPSEYYTSIKDLNLNMTNLLDSLVDDSGKVEYSSKAAILNVRKLFENAGQLYVEKLMQE